MTKDAAKPAKRKRKASQHQINRVFIGSTMTASGGHSCRAEWAGAMPARGPLMIREGMYRRERQRAAYELAFGLTKPSDRVVPAVCGNPRCLDQRHLYVIPDPVQPKPSKASKASRAGVPGEPAAVIGTTPDTADTP